MKKITMIALAGLLAVSPMLGGCAILQNQDPQEVLNETAALFAIAEGTYDALCSVPNPPTFCTNGGADYLKALKALQAAFQTAEAAITISGDINTATVQALIQALANDWAAYNQIVESTKLQAVHAGLSVPMPRMAYSSPAVGLEQYYK